MVKVITYGTYDLLHYGHVRLLERAKALGDYLIVGVTADDFDKVRGKINVQQSLMERVEAVRATGIADEIIIEEYEGQKIDDIKRYDVDIFTVGSDWVGHFDYLNEYCKVVYLERTQGVSSSELRAEKRAVNLGLVGDSLFLNKIIDESKFVNGVETNAALTKSKDVEQKVGSNVNSLSELLALVDAIYIRSLPKLHYNDVKTALLAGRHVLCESPLTLSREETDELFQIALDNNLILMEAIKTAYSTAFRRLLLLIKSGKIGEVVSVDVTCTSIRSECNEWDGVSEWAPTALLPVFEILGVDYKDKKIITFQKDGKNAFAKFDFLYKKAVATIKVGSGVKAEGSLIVSGTEGYIYVPAPWWKTDYFEIRYEDQNKNKRYFYQLDGEGIRYELVAFLKSIETTKDLGNIDHSITSEISAVMQAFEGREYTVL